MIEPLWADDAFLAKVREGALECAEQLNIWWLGQSGFLLQYKGKHVLFDPYLSDSLTKKYAGTDKPHVRMSRRVVAPERLDFIDVVSASHIHTDHLDAETLQPLVVANPLMKIVAPEAIRSEAAARAGVDAGRIVGLDDGMSVDIDGFRFTGIAAAHNTIERDAAGRCKFLGYVVEVGPFKIYHSGDTLVYDGLAERLEKLGPIHLALLPINGDRPERRVAGNMDGVQAANLALKIDAWEVYPCHYDMFEFNTVSPDAFVAECKRLGQYYEVLGLGQWFSFSFCSLGDGAKEKKGEGL